MGICITYKGKLNDPARVSELIAEVQSWCGELGWPCQEVTEPIEGIALRWGSRKQKLVHTTLRGIWAQPPGTETLVFSFDDRGRLVRYLELPHELLRGKVCQEETYYLAGEIWVKTSGQVEEHIAIVDMLRKLKKKYITNLKVADEANYWETSSRRELTHHHRLMDMALSFFENPEVMRGLLGLDDDATIKRIEKNVRLPVNPNRAARPARTVN